MSSWPLRCERRFAPLAPVAPVVPVLPLPPVFVVCAAEERCAPVASERSAVVPDSVPAIDVAAEEPMALDPLPLTLLPEKPELEPASELPLRFRDLPWP